MDSAQEPLTSPSEARWVILPSLPTTRLSRSSSLAMRSFSSTTSLKVSATLPATPVQSTGRRTEKSPFFKRHEGAQQGPMVQFVPGSFLQDWHGDFSGEGQNFNGRGIATFWSPPRIGKGERPAHKAPACTPDTPGLS